MRRAARGKYYPSGIVTDLVPLQRSHLQRSLPLQLIHAFGAFFELQLRRRGRCRRGVATPLLLRRHSAMTSALRTNV